MLDIFDKDYIKDVKYIDEATRAEQLKNAVEKARERKVEPKGDSPLAKKKFKNRQDLKKDAIKYAEKRLDYHEDEVEHREKEKEIAKKKKERGPGILRRLTGRV